MGGKRPDQYQIDPGEATRTDYEATADADKVDLKTEQASRIHARPKGRQMIPPKVPNAEVERHRARELERRERQHEGEDAGSDSE